MATTMKDIAREVGVSQATVSYVLSGRTDRTISADTRRRITETADRLGYRLNRLARAMVTSQTGILGALVGKLVGDWDAHLAEGIENEAFRQHAPLLLGCYHMDRAREQLLLERFLELRVDGVLVQPPTVSEVGRYAALLEAGVPVVFLVLCPPGLQADVVQTNNVKAGYEVGQHLLGAGRTRLVSVAPYPDNPDLEERCRGFEMAAQEWGLAPPPALRMAREPHGDLVRLGYAALSAHLDSGVPVDGVFAVSVWVALGALQALQERGIKVGEDVALVGFDDVPEMEATDPPLTTVRQPMGEIGAEGVGLLMKRVNAGASRPPQRVLLEPTLVVRASSTGRGA